MTVLREGRKAQTMEASLLQGGKPVARCTAVLLKTDAASTPPAAPLVPPAKGPEAGTPIPALASFVNADLTMVLWRTPRVPWILLAAETCVGERGTGVAHALLSDVDGPFGRCAQTLIFDHRP